MASDPSMQVSAWEMLLVQAVSAGICYSAANVTPSPALLLENAKKAGRQWKFNASVTTWKLTNALACRIQFSHKWLQSIDDDFNQIKIKTTEKLQQLPGKKDNQKKINLWFQEWMLYECML